MRFRPVDVLNRAGIGLVLGALAAACSTGSPAAAPATTTSTVSPTRATTTTVAPPTTPSSTTTLVPPSPQPSPDQAADQMIAAWAAGDRGAAGAVATPTAVDQLFASPYPGTGLAIPRGCSAAFTPIVCTYGPPGGASSSDSIYQLSLSQAPKGWYVSSVAILP